MIVVWERYCYASPKPELFSSFFHFFSIHISANMSPFGLKISQMIFHTETSKRMYNWSFLFVVLHKPTLLPSTLKAELRNRFNLISEERVQFCEQNSETLMKIGWKIRKLWHFEVSQIFTKHFLTSRYEYANERVDDVIASLLAIYFVHKILKNSIFCAYLW